MNDPRSAKGAENPELEAARKRIAELEQQLAEKENDRQFHAIFDNMIVGIGILDANGHFLKVNPTLMQLLGYAEEEIVGRHYSVFTHPDDASHQEALSSQLDDGNVDSYTFEKRYIRKDGGIIWIQLFISAIRDDAGKIINLIGILFDITKIKNNEKKIRESEQRLRVLFDNVIAGIGFANADGFFVEANKGMEEIYGRSIEEIKTKNIRELSHPDDLENELPLLKEMFENKRDNYRYEKRVIKPDGSVGWIDLGVAALRDEDGQVTHIAGVARDITDSRKYTEQLKESEQQFRLLFDNLLAGISITDLEGRYLMVNQEFARIFGYSLEELASLDVTALSYPEDVERDLQLTGELMQGKRNHYRIERRIIRKDGYTGWVDLTVRLIKDAAGNPQKFFAVMLDITQQRTIKRALEKSEKQMRTIFDNAVAGIAMTDANGNVVFTNPSFTDMLGYDRDSLTGHSFSKFTHPDDLLWEEKLFKQVVEKRIGNARFEKRYLKKDGGYIWADASVSVIFNDEGKPHNFLAVVSDITLKKEAEKELQATEKRWRTAFEKVGDGVWLWNVQTNDLYLSPSWKAMIGFKDDELPNEFNSFESRVHPDDIDDIYRQLGWHLNGSDEKYTAEFRLRAKNGSYVWILARGRILETNAEGEPLLMIGTHTDLTKRIEAEQQLKESEQLQKILISSLHNGLLMIDHDGQIIEYNNAAARILGFPLERKEVYKISELSWGCIWEDGTAIPPEQRPMLTPLQSRGPVKDSVVGILNTDDKRVWLSVNSEPLFHPGEQEPYAVVVSFSDITRQKENEQRLAELVATKDRFFSIIAHDLKSPFHALLGLSSMLTRKKGEDKEAIDRISEMIHRSSKQSYTLLNNLLEWSRSQTNRITYEPKKTQLYSVVKDISDALQGPMNMKELTTVVQIDNDVYVYADSNMLDSIIRNLLSNAIKYSRPGSPVMVRAERRDDLVLVSVRDFGIGIEPERLDKLFRIDHKVSTPGTDNEPGTGLGLILCKDFVEKHGGTIEVKSEEGEGSTFTFTLPAGPLE